MFQTIQGKRVYIADLVELPKLPVHDGGLVELKPYAEALTNAIRDKIITKPGKYAIEVSRDHGYYLIHEVVPPKE